MLYQGPSLGKVREDISLGTLGVFTILCVLVLGSTKPDTPAPTHTTLNPSLRRTGGYGCFRASSWGARV